MGKEKRIEKRNRSLAKTPRNDTAHASLSIYIISTSMKGELMRAILMLIAILYVPVLGCFADEEKRTVGAVISVAGLTYAIMYDYLYFRKGEK